MKSIEKKLNHLNQGGEPPSNPKDGDLWEHPDGRWFTYVEDKWLELEGLVTQLAQKIVLNLNKEMCKVTQLPPPTTWIVAGLQAASVIETLPTFVGAGNKAEVDGVSFLGTLNGRYKVYADPHYPVDEFLVGYKGDQFLRTGYIFAPWIMLYSTPLIVLDDFIARKGFASMYGKKVVNNLYYVKGNVLNYPNTF